MSTPVIETPTPEEPDLDAALQTPPKPAEAGISASDDTDDKPIPVPLATLSSFLAAAAAGWMCAGLFEGSFARIVGILAAFMGSALIGLSYRTKSPSIIQYLTPVALAVVAAVLILPDISGGASLPGLVLEAIRQGGLSQPPVPFAPGWTFAFFFLMGLLGAGANALSISLNKPKLGLLVPMPFVFATAITQPKGATLTSSLVALFFAIGAMAVAFGADLSRDGSSSGSFEARRLIRGGVVLLGTVALIAAVSQLGFLFPKQTENDVLPPHRPQVPPPMQDHELFRFTSPVKVPVRLGVLDVYGIKENAWLTPPFKRKEVRDLPPTGTVPELGSSSDNWSTVVSQPAGRDGKTVTVTIRITDIPGRDLPTAQNPLTITGNTRIQYDPRTQSIRAHDARARDGMTYTIVFPAPPDGRQLQQAGRPPARLAEFLKAPPAPPSVADLLSKAPTSNLFDRLQYVRTAYYSKVVAAGAGQPVDVPPQRVAEMLAGKEATPYEITAGEALLARWAGVPARIGYGYYGGQTISGQADTVSVHPVNGAMWLETYFDGFGWVPILGTPPKAKSSLDQNKKKQDPTVTATDELALTVYVPIKVDTFQLLFELVRFWALRVVPVLVGLIALLTFYPGVLKILRRSRRRKWAAGLGPMARIGVAYIEFRDVANDYNFGDPMHTALEFVLDLAPDEEHAEFAWLVTRALWGDLSRDLRREDAEAAEEMSKSLIKRLRRANNGLPRLIAFASRASLKDPYNTEAPNLWFGRPSLPRLRLPLRGRVLQAGGGTAVVLLLLGLLTGCAQTLDLKTLGAPQLPKKIAPTDMPGLVFHREVKLESAFQRRGSLVSSGQVFSIHQGPNVQGSLEVGSFKPAVSGSDRAVRDGVLSNIGLGTFTLTRLGTDRVYVQHGVEQQLYLWFAPSGRYFELMVARRAFANADQLFVDLLAFQRGAAAVPASEIIPRPDPRRGVEFGDSS